MKTKRKPGRKSDLERKLIAVAALARAFYSKHVELSLEYGLIDAEISVLDNGLSALETMHSRLKQLYKVGRAKTMIEQQLIKIVALAVELGSRRESLHTTRATIVAKLNVIERAVWDLKKVHDFYLLRIESKQVGQL
jgi:hypothetical protein